MKLSWLVLPLLLLYLFHLGGVGFLSTDEPRYASIGRDMARSGDWVTPRLYGVPWFEKSPLLYWMTGIATRAGLRDEWAARLPVALMSVVFLLFFFTTLEREFSARIAITATAILSTCAGWLAYSFGALTDVPMTAALSAATLVALFDTRPRRGWLAGALLGVAMLAKGFAPLVYFAPVWAIARGRRLAMAAAAILVAAPWYLLCFARNGSAFWNEFFWKHHVDRFVSASALQHGQPVWYYAPVLLAGLFPWTPLIALLARKKLYDDARLRFLLIWLVLAPVIFFTVAQNKLPSYVLPVLPPLAVALAVALHKTRWLSWWIAACVLLMILLPAIAAGLPDALLLGARKTQWRFSLEGLPFIAAAAVVWVLAFRGNTTAAILTSAATVALGVAYLKIETFPVLEQHVSARGFWRAHADEVANACLESNVSRAWEYGLKYYAGRALPRCGLDVHAQWGISEESSTLLLEKRAR